MQSESEAARMPSQEKVSRLKFVLLFLDLYIFYDLVIFISSCFSLHYGLQIFSVTGGVILGPML